MTACPLGWCGGGDRGSSGTASQDQRFSFAAQDADLKLIPGTGRLIDLGSNQLVQPVCGVALVPQTMMGHGEKGKRLCNTFITPCLRAFVQATDGFLHPAGAIEGRP